MLATEVQFELGSQMTTIEIPGPPWPVDSATA
jgi:hypothetical protein